MKTIIYGLCRGRPQVIKVANGYMVIPNSPNRDGCSDEEVFIFESWEKMIDHLHKEIHQEVQPIEQGK